MIEAVVLGLVLRTVPDYCEVRWSGENVPMLSTAMRDVTRASGVVFTRVSDDPELIIRRGPRVKEFVAYVKPVPPPRALDKAEMILTDRVFTKSKRKIRSVLQHELGHVLGLIHSSNKNDVMYWRANGKINTKGWTRNLGRIYRACR